MGYTVGEEAIFVERNPVVRQESCLCTNAEGAALLQVSIDQLVKMGTSRQLRISRGISMVKDFKLLMSVLQDNYE